MIKTIIKRCTLVGFLGTLVVGFSGCAQPKLRSLIIDGQNNHDWPAMTSFIKMALLDTGRFTVEVATTPSKKAPDEDWLAFRPDFSKYDVVLSNYNDYPYKGGRGHWPREVKKALEAFVSGGGGLLVIHAANNAFPHWPEWNKMIGLGWRKKDFGDALSLDDQGKLIRIPAGQGFDASHGDQHNYKITVRDPQHPIMKGMPKEWMHAWDELYHAQRGPAINLQILASAYSSKETKGTGAHEPMVWAVRYGGKVVTTVMGHCTAEYKTAPRCVGFQTIVARSAEWVATGKVTIPVPKLFPTDTHISLVDVGEEMIGSKDRDLQLGPIVER